MLLRRYGDYAGAGVLVSVTPPATAATGIELIVTEIHDYIGRGYAEVKKECTQMHSCPFMLTPPATAATGIELIVTKIHDYMDEATPK
ncbi:hypothetical protein V498_02714 [Pseudogymnoascus sp. VKM F-4517 (FW-2822)]|nr:hypothetical protein V498_02714 [Pseudogymnoascus sp. VKM F-4517 (FW-2822)]